MRHIIGGTRLPWASLPPSMWEKLKKRNWKMAAFLAGLALGEHRVLGPVAPTIQWETWRTVIGAKGSRVYGQWRESGATTPLKTTLNWVECMCVN